MPRQVCLILTVVEDVSEAPLAMAQEEPTQDELLFDQHSYPPYKKIKNKLPSL